MITKVLGSLRSYVNQQKSNANSSSPYSYADNVMLLTHRDFDGTTVGLAFVGTMCSDGLSTSVNQVSFNKTLVLIKRCRLMVSDKLK